MTTLQTIQKLLPDAELIYHRDDEYRAYGDLNEEDLNTAVCHSVGQLKKQGAKIIVIACNTATTKYIRLLRQEYPDLIFVGTEPAIKLAVDNGGREILLMATPNTVTSEQVARLVRRNITSQNLTMLACPGLADMVERCVEVKEKLASFSASPQIIAKINNLFARVGNIDKIDTVVLGCTHYVLLMEVLQDILPNATFVDGNLGVAKRVKQIFQELEKSTSA